MTRLTLHQRLLVVASAGGALFGYSISAMNQTLEEVRSEFRLSSVEQGIVVSALVAGCLVGCLAAGAVTDRLGRRAVLSAAGAVGIVAALLCAVAPAAWFLAGGRFVLGLAVGVTSAIAPVLLGELASAQARGSVMMVYQLALTVAILAALLLGLEQAAAHQWRWMFVVNALPAAVLLISVRLLPLTPGVLMAQGRDDQALHVLRAGRSAVEAEQEYAFLRATRGRPTGRRTTWQAILDRENRLPVAIAVGAGLMAALVGIGAVVYYSTLVFATAGVGGRLGAQIASLSFGIVNVAASVASLWLIRRYGRRPLLSVGLAGMAAALTVSAICLVAVGGSVGGAVTVAAVLIFVICFAFSAGPLTWLLIAEVLRPEIRAQVAGAAAAANWAANLLVALLFPVVVGTPGSPSKVGAAFLFFAALTVGFLVLLRRYVPETKDRPLAEVQALLEEGKDGGVSAGRKFR
ncbi:sugar porter family MFS transporter [Streptomyces sp. NPDC058475]|uniref:sugar porter family MFS transporter n=1 Tax=Streptomyces sp. NPDC058475 TaxID=3346518 RepID=UPI0036679616